MGLSIVLLEPEIPQNAGNIARTCAALGLSLHLIEPLGFSLKDKFLKRAGLDYWHLVEVAVHPDIAAFLSHAGSVPVFWFTTKARSVYSEVTYPEQAYFLFGKESSGIPEEILVQHADWCVRIPMKNEARSLNLSNSAAVAAYEFCRQKDFSGLELEGKLHRLSWQPAT